jgi:hypothetical protein
LLTTDSGNGLNGRGERVRSIRFRNPLPVIRSPSDQSLQTCPVSVTWQFFAPGLAGERIADNGFGERIERTGRACPLNPLQKSVASNPFTLRPVPTHLPRLRDLAGFSHLAWRESGLLTTDSGNGLNGRRERVRSIRFRNPLPVIRSPSDQSLQTCPVSVTWQFFAPGLAGEQIADNGFGERIERTARAYPLNPLQKSVASNPFTLRPVPTHLPRLRDLAGFSHLAWRESRLLTTDSGNGLNGRREPIRSIRSRNPLPVIRSPTLPDVTSTPLAGEPSPGRAQTRPGRENSGANPLTAAIFVV